MSTLEELQQQLTQAQTQLHEIVVQMQPLQQRRHQQQTLIDSICSRMDEIRAAASGEPDWAWLLEEDGSSKSVKFQARQQALKKWDLSGDTYFYAINQAAIRIAMRRGDDAQLERVMEGLSTLLPYLRPLPDGEVRINIMESTLSEYGTYYLLLSEDKVKFVCKTYGSVRRIKRFSQLREAVAYVQQCHCYEVLEPKKKS